MSILDINNSIGTICKNDHKFDHDRKNFLSENVFLISLLFQISKMLFLLGTITFMISEMSIATSKNRIIDIKN